MLGKNLRRLRESKGWTQQELADKIKISRGTYAHWEIDKRTPDLEMLKKLATLFEVTLDYLADKEALQIIAFNEIDDYSLRIAKKIARLSEEKKKIMDDLATELERV